METPPLKTSVSTVDDCSAALSSITACRMPKHQRVITCFVPTSTVISSNAEQSLTLNFLSNIIAEMVDMGTTVRSSITRYVTTSFTYPPPPSPGRASCASLPLPCASPPPGAHRISTVIGCLHAGHSTPDTSVTFMGFPRHGTLYAEHRKYRRGGGGGGGGGSAPSPPSSGARAAEGSAGLRSASRSGGEGAEVKKASSRARAPA
nr:unnamed protein product [Digitaria exilis]